MQKGAITMRNQSKLQLPVVFVDAKPISSPEDAAAEPAMDLMIYDVTYLHVHRHLELGLCVEGTGICQVEDTRYPFSQGDVQIIFPYQRHLSQTTGGAPSRWHWANIDVAEVFARAGFTSQEQLRRLLTREMGLCGIINPERYGKICESVKSIFRLLYAPKDTVSHPQMALASKLLELILMLCDVSRELPKLPLDTGNFAAELNPALEHISENIRQGQIPKVQNLPGLCGMSQANFRRVFEKTLGISPKEYITVCCINRAKKLLVNTDLPVTRIAAEVGYENISGFNRCFLEKTGMSPTQFRTANGRR